MTVCGFTWGRRTDPCVQAAKVLADSPAGLTGQLAGQILVLCPEGAIGHLAKGYQSERKGDPNEAIEEYRKAIVADASLYQAHGNLGLLLLEKGADNEAASELSEALSGKSDARYHRGMAKLLNGGGGTALMLFHCQEALKGNSEDQSVRTWLADSWARSRLQKRH